MFLKLLKARLQTGTKKSNTDQHSNIIYTDNDIFSDDTLSSFLELSLSEFNQTPNFSNYSFQCRGVEKFTDIIIEGAYLIALASQSLIECGKEYQINDNGVFFDPPKISELLMDQYLVLLGHHFEKLKNIKSHL